MNRFNIRRMALLVRRDIFTQFSGYLAALGGFFVLLCLAYAAALFGDGAWKYDLFFFSLFLFPGGFVFTAGAFHELRERAGRTFYLSIPASFAEKLAAKIIITGPGWVLAWLLTYFLFSAAAMGFTSFFPGVDAALFNPFASGILRHIHIYLVAHSVFLLGAIYFRRSAFWKTLLCVFALCGASFLFIAFVIYVLHWSISLHGTPYVAFRLFDIPLDRHTRLPAELREILATTFAGARILLGYALAPFLWLVTYFRLKETEA